MKCPSMLNYRKCAENIEKSTNYLLLIPGIRKRSENDTLEGAHIPVAKYAKHPPQGLRLRQ